MTVLDLTVTCLDFSPVGKVRTFTNAEFGPTLCVPTSNIRSLRFQPMSLKLPAVDLVIGLRSRDKSVTSMEADGAGLDACEVLRHVLGVPHPLNRYKLQCGPANNSKNFSVEHFIIAPGLLFCLSPVDVTSG